MTSTLGITTLVEQMWLDLQNPETHDDLMAAVKALAAAHPTASNRAMLGVIAATIQSHNDRNDLALANLRIAYESARKSRNSAIIHYVGNVLAAQLASMQQRDKAMAIRTEMLALVPGTYVPTQLELNKPFRTIFFEALATAIRRMQQLV